MGQWVGAQGRPKVTKISKTCPHCDVTSRKPPPKTKKLFLCQLEDYWIRRGFEQLCSGWRFMAKKGLANCGC